MKDEFSTDDPFLATIFIYNGCPCIKVTGSTNQDVSGHFESWKYTGCRAVVRNLATHRRLV